MTYLRDVNEPKPRSKMAKKASAKSAKQKQGDTFEVYDHSTKTTSLMSETQYQLLKNETMPGVGLEPRTYRYTVGEDKVAVEPEVQE